MKKNIIASIVLVLFLTVVVAGTIFAQSTPAASPDAGPHGKAKMSPAERQEKMVQRMTKMLDLTPDQQTKVRGIIANRMTQMQALKNDTALSKEQKKAKFKEMRASFETQMKSVLTADQQKKWDEAKKKMMEKRKDRKGHHGCSNCQSSPAGK